MNLLPRRSKKKIAINRAKELLKEIKSNSDIKRLVTNQLDFSSSEGFSTTRNFGRIGAYSGYDSLHTTLYGEFGYPNDLDFNDFWSMYRRSGLAQAVVEAYPSHGWKENPIITGGTEFESALERMAKRLKIWDRLKSVDNRQRVGQYAGLYIQVADDMLPSEPMQRVTAETSIIRLIPYYEGQIQVIETESDPRNPDFGMPKFYQIDNTSVGSRQSTPSQTFRVHPSRIIITSETADDGGIYGKSCLESVFNALMDAQKVGGSSGEGFYRNAAQNIVFELADEENWTLGDEELDEIESAVEEFVRNRMRKQLTIPGIKANPLNTTMIQPKESFDIAVDVISAGTKVPRNILTGKQTGVLAGDQDSEQFLSEVKVRQTHYQTSLVTDLIEWLMMYGALPSSSYEIEFPDPMARSDDAKADTSKKLAEINQLQFRSGQPTVFTPDEIREAAGYEPEAELEIDETLTDE